MRGVQEFNVWILHPAQRDVLSLDYVWTLHKFGQGVITAAFREDSCACEVALIKSGVAGTSRRAGAMDEDLSYSPWYKRTMPVSIIYVTPVVSWLEVGCPIPGAVLASLPWS